MICKEWKLSIDTSYGKRDLIAEIRAAWKLWNQRY